MSRDSYIFSISPPPGREGNIIFENVKIRGIMNFEEKKFSKGIKKIYFPQSVRYLLGGKNIISERGEGERI